MVHKSHLFSEPQPRTKQKTSSWEKEHSIKKKKKQKKGIFLFCAQEKSLEQKVGRHNEVTQQIPNRIIHMWMNFRKLDQML